MASKVDNICLCGFKEEQHIDLKALEATNLFEAYVAMDLHRTMLLEQQMLYGKSSCSNYRRDNLRYLEEVGNGR